MRHAAARAALAAAVPIMGVLLALDATPRFMQGDSISYLMTGKNGVDSFPPDRSWIYGLATRGLLIGTHGLLGQMLLDLAGLAVFVWAAARLLPSGRAATVAAVGFGACLASDPLVETYVRFTMSDLPAALLFAGYVCLLAGRLPGAGVAAPPGPRRAALGWLGIVACGAGAVAFRVAYAPIEIGAALLTALTCLPAPRRRVLLPLALAGLVPLASTVTLGQLNGAVFAGRFGDGPFVNRLSGVFLMGVFSPALTADDIRAAGVAVSDDEVARMQLGNDDERIDQVWGTQDFWLRRVVARRLHATGEYDRRVDRAARRMVVAGVTRHPLDFARVYLRSLAEQFSPARWRLHLEGELGLERPLDAWVVADVNRYAARPISPGITHRITLVPRLLRWSVGAYPVLLGLGLLVAAIALLGPAAPSARLPAASLVVSFLAAPLYGNYVIPRYLLASVMFTWLLLPQAALRLAGWAATVLTRPGGTAK